MTGRLQALTAHSLLLPHRPPYPHLQLALKHRQNKTQRQRIIILLGSPLSLTTDEKALIRLGKKLKKNNVAVDVVYFAGSPDEEDIVVDEGGAVGGDEGVLGRFVESVGSGDNR